MSAMTTSDAAGDRRVEGVEDHGPGSAPGAWAIIVLPDARGPRSELLDGGGAERVGGGEDDASALGPVAAGELADGRGLAGPVDADDQDDRGRRRPRRARVANGRLARHEEGRELGADAGLIAGTDRGACGPARRGRSRASRRRRRRSASPRPRPRRTVPPPDAPPSRPASRADEALPRVLAQRQAPGCRPLGSVRAPPAGRGGAGAGSGAGSDRAAGPARARRRRPRLGAVLDGPRRRPRRSPARPPGLATWLAAPGQLLLSSGS